MRILIAISLFMLASPALHAQKAPKLNPYVLQYDAGSGKISKTEHIDTIVWFGNGYGLAKVTYENGKFEAELAKTKGPDFEKYNFGANKEAWGVIDTSGKFKIPPVYSDVDVWGNNMGMLYRLQYSKKFCGYLYCYILDMNKGSIKYLGDNVDRAYFAGPDYIVLQQLNQNVGVINTKGELLVDTTAARRISFGSFDSLQTHDKRSSCITPPTLGSVGKLQNPSIWIYSDPQKGETAVDANFKTLIPWDKYGYIKSLHGSLVASKNYTYNTSYFIYTLDGKLFDSNLDSLAFDEELQVWALYKFRKVRFVNKDLTPVTPEVEALINAKFLQAQETIELNKKAAEAQRLKEEAERMAKAEAERKVKAVADSTYYSQFSPSNLAGMVAGNYKQGTFIVDLSDPSNKPSNKPNIISFNGNNGGRYFIVTWLAFNMIQVSPSQDPNTKVLLILKPDPTYPNMIRLYEPTGEEVGYYTKHLYELRIKTQHEGRNGILAITKEKK